MTGRGPNTRRGGGSDAAPCQLSALLTAQEPPDGGHRKRPSPAKTKTAACAPKQRIRAGAVSPSGEGSSSKRPSNRSDGATGKRGDSAGGATVGPLLRPPPRPPLNHFSRPSAPLPFLRLSEASEDSSPCSAFAPAEPLQVIHRLSRPAKQNKAHQRAFCQIFVGFEPHLVLSPSVESQTPKRK